MMLIDQTGSGAGHAIEDAFILGLVMRDFFANPAPGLAAYAGLYQAVRRPRAQKAQITSRQAGDVYEMEGKEFEGCKTFEDCLPIVREKLGTRMKWVWGHDLDADYNQVRDQAGLTPKAVSTISDVVLPKVTGKTGDHVISATEVQV